MKFTALEEYGLRCILHLARKDLAHGGAAPAPGGRRGARGGGAPSLERASLTLGRIAEDEGITQQYAGKIFRVLARAKLVESERGRKGGYRLARRPEEVSVLEVLVALGGRFFAPERCGRYAGLRDACVNAGACAVRLLWSETGEAIEDVLSRYSLRDLVERERELCGDVGRLTGASDSEARPRPAAAIERELTGGRA
ncbi:MAG: RrF2 family transcriptional regulator [Planctomycetota bacterium]